jgi:hypothetical protein
LYSAENESTLNLFFALISVPISFSGEVEASAEVKGPKDWNRNCSTFKKNSLTYIEEKEKMHNKL